MRSSKSRCLTSVLLLATCVLAAACSLRALAVNRIGDALASGGSVFASDDDPELVGDALPFSLKLIESLLAENPHHRGLLLAATRGFTQYGYGWVAPRSWSREAPDAAAQEERARRIYARARAYGLRGVEETHAGFGAALRNGPAEAVREMTKADVPLLYWTASAWALEISLSKDRPESVADLPAVEAMIDRALELDEAFGSGSIHSFLISYEPVRGGGEGDWAARAQRHFERAVELSGGKLASPYVALAEAVTVQKQDRAGFDSLLAKALAVDADAAPESRVENLLAQQRARWLTTHADDLFLEPSQGGSR